MYRIGDFSTLSKTTVKTLRYYEKEGLLIPSYINPETGYRYYETLQLLELSKIIALRQMGISIPDIKEVFLGKDFKMLLQKRKEVLEEDIAMLDHQLSRICYLLEGKHMKYEVMVKELPAYSIYYKEGIITDYSEITNFILSSAEECLKTNKDLKCIEPDYCYINYLDDEFKEKDIKIRYAQAVVKEGVPNETIQFETLKPVTAVCIYHKGAYALLGEAYGFIMKWIEDNGYRMIESPRERYIDGIWNKEETEEWLTEIQVPVQKK